MNRNQTPDEPMATSATQRLADEDKLNELPKHFVNAVEGYITLNMMEDAANECLAMVDRYPDNAQLLVYSGGRVSHGTSEQVKRLLVSIDRYLQKHPDALRVREVRAVLLSVEKRYAESLEEFSKVPPEKRRAEAYWAWFNTLISSGARGEALHWIKTVWPHYWQKIRDAHFNTFIAFLWDISACLFEAGEYEEAEVGYKFLLEHDPGAIGVYLEYGKLLTRTKRVEEADALFRQGLRLTWKEIDDQLTYPGAINYFPIWRRDIENQIKAELKQLQPSVIT